MVQKEWILRFLVSWFRVGGFRKILFHAGFVVVVVILLSQAKAQGRI